METSSKWHFAAARPLGKESPEPGRLEFSCVVASAYWFPKVVTPGNSFVWCPSNDRDNFTRNLALESYH